MLDDTAYVLASYTSLTGTQFSSVSDVPTGYVIDYNYLGANQIAIVAVPEPGAISLLGVGLLLVLGIRRRFFRVES